MKLWKKIKSWFSRKKKNEFEYSSLVWSFGGLDGRFAKQVAEIKNLRVDIASRKMYYSWVSGGCEALGAANKDEYKNTYACIFYWDTASKKWIGGKFDEISTSRTWRPLDNCKNYRGWTWGPFAAAGKYAFLVISRDGTRRTNVIFS